MKKILNIILYTTIAITLFTSCTQNNKETNPITKNSKKLKVYTSFYPMYDFAKKIGGDKIELKNLLAEGEEIHSWEPKPSDIVDLKNADVFIYNGLSMEHWVEEVIPTLNSKHLVVVQTAQNIEFLDPEGQSKEHEGVYFEKPDEYDPHVWLSIKNAKKQMEIIKNVFGDADPTNKDYYQENYKKYEKQFSDLSAKFESELLPFKGRSIVVAHESFGYLCNDYGLKQIGIESIIPDSEPDPARISEVIKIVKENNINVIFYEELQGSKVAEIIAEETGTKIGILNTLETLSEEDQNASKDYISVMEENLQNIKSSFEPK